MEEKLLSESTGLFMNPVCVCDAHCLFLLLGFTQFLLPLVFFFFKALLQSLKLRLLPQTQPSSP